MTVEYILNLNIPDLDKINLIKFFLEGGNIKPNKEIIIGNKKYKVEIADTPEHRAVGLSRCRSLASDEGMLFIHENVTNGYYTMKETSIDLDIIFIDDDMEVIQVNSVKAYTEKPVRCRGFKYVLEVNINSGIKEGDELDLDSDFTEEDKQSISLSKMLVLNGDGDVQYRLVGGERIVSMIKTRQLIKAAIKAYRSDDDKDYRRVGKLIINELDAQDNREPQYTEK